ncbi:MAG: response regulator [Methylococcales bacterium]
MLKNKATALVYVVDDEFAIRDSLSLLIESTGQPVKSFASAEAFLNHYRPEQPGCLILDVRMPSMSGLELQNALLTKGISIPIIFMSGHAEIPDSAKAFRAGAVDFLQKPFSNADLLERIEEALEKDRYTRANVIEKGQLLERVNRLTPREKEVLSLIVSNHSNKESAKILDISNRTVDAHRSKIMEKLQVDNVAELVLMVMRLDIFNKNTRALDEGVLLNNNSSRYF